MKRTLLNSRKQSAEHDQLVDCIRNVQPGTIPHIHSKPRLSEFWRKVAWFALFAGLLAFAVMAGYDVTHHDESEAYPYKHEGESIPIP